MNERIWLCSGEIHIAQYNVYTVGDLLMATVTLQGRVNNPMILEFAQINAALKGLKCTC